MSWVSYTKLNSLMTALRNKFVSSEIVITDTNKTAGVHLNHTAQDGLVTISPLTEDGSTPAALWVTDSAANNATEITGGTISYVTDNGKSTEDYTGISLVGGVVNMIGKNGASKRITNVATPVNDLDAVNKAYVDSVAGEASFYKYTLLPPDGYDFGFTIAKEGDLSKVSDYDKMIQEITVENGVLFNTAVLVADISDCTIRGSEVIASNPITYIGASKLYFYVPSEFRNSIENNESYQAFFSCSGLIKAPKVTKVYYVLNTKTDYTATTYPEAMKQYDNISLKSDNIKLTI